MELNGGKFWEFSNKILDINESMVRHALIIKDLDFNISHNWHKKK